MSDTINFDFSQINDLVADLGVQPGITAKKAVQALEVTATNVKKAWSQKLVGTEGVPHGARTITYDLIGTEGDVSTLTAEIGAEDGRLQAPIVAVIEYGAPGNNLSPRGFGAAALQENQADFVKGLELASEVQL